MNKRIIQKERKITVKLIENEKVHNHKLAEFFARRINERGIEKS